MITYAEAMDQLEAEWIEHHGNAPIEGGRYQHWVKTARHMVQEQATVRIIFKCRRCKTAKTYDYTNALRPVRTDPSTGKLVGACEDYTCPTCRRERIANTVSGRVTDQPCGSRCMGATGPSCDCACGGANHGRAHL
jgi:hypothetical protein